MSNFKEVEGGDIIQLSKLGIYDVVAHGCNCFCSMTDDIGVKFAEEFKADQFPLEAEKFKGMVNKLGMIESKKVNDIIVVNAYTQFMKEPSLNSDIPLNYSALSLCLIKINNKFKGKKILLPLIGVDEAGGESRIVQTMIKNNLVDMDVTLIV